MDKLGNRLVYIRESLLDISQDDFAGLIGVSQMSLSHWESGNRNPKGQYIDNIVSICQSKGIKISKKWLETGEEPMLESKSEEVNNSNDQTERLRKLAEYWKQKYIDAIEGRDSL